MVTISDKRFGELVAKSIALDVYKSIANNQYEVIRKQEEASVTGMAEIKRIREELAAAREQVEYWKQVVNDCEKAVVFWREKFMEKLNYSKSLEEAIEGVRNSVKGL